jgi:glycosyltransferase involved in cell wall biosynthesis
MKRIVVACDSALVAARRQRDYVRRLGIPAERIFFGYDAVDNDYFARTADEARKNASAIRASRGLPDHYLLASARFIAKKNYPRLVEAFSAALRTHDAGHDLVILGDGSERQNIERAARHFKVEDRVRLLGFKSYAALPFYYGLSSGFVHVPTVEQWGLVVNEAAASGLPLIVSASCGAAAALIDPGVNGYRVDPRSIDDITGAIVKVMILSDDERSAMGAASRRIASEWGPERFSQGLLAACEAALTCPPRELGWIDRALFRLLSHLRTAHVS